MVPQMFIDDKKCLALKRAKKNLNIYESDCKFLSNMITGDDSWPFEYYPGTKRQWSAWHTPESHRPKKARLSWSKINATFIVFFDSKGLVYHDFVPHGTTVNAKFYVKALNRLKHKVLRFQPDIAKDLNLRHDIAPVKSPTSWPKEECRRFSSLRTV